MVLKNRHAFADLHAFAQKEDGEYTYRTWKTLSSEILMFALFLKSKGLSKGDRIAFVTRNTYQRLVSELAVMSCGLVSVPIFPGYADDFVSELLEFSEVKMMIIDIPSRVTSLPSNNMDVVILDNSPEKAGSFSGRANVHLYCDIIKIDRPFEERKFDSMITLFGEITPDDLALIMYTSGTTNFPKGAMLTHFNILSQQSALKTLWNPEPGMRFLCYLPWHHSFGGLFERFFVLHSGGCLAIDDSWGKDVDKLFRNFEKIKPHIYFSVPKVYQEIVARVLTSKEAEKTFFHKDLKFVFTAAAPLPLSTSEVFSRNNIPVIEGWGLTETSPCCTLTDLSVGRKPGVVGFPIPDVEIKLDEDEILVRGPNVMKGYFKLPEKTSEILDKNGWFRTGDLGKMTADGLKILSRKDRVFKLSNGAKVFPTDIEESIRTKCKLIKYIYVFGSGLNQPCALIFPNYELVSARRTGSQDEPGCVNPPSLKDLANCLHDCLRKVNREMVVKSERIGTAVIINRELCIERNELTPSFKLVPKKVEERYGNYIQCLVDGNFDVKPEDAFLIDIRK